MRDDRHHGHITVAVKQVVGATECAVCLRPWNDCHGRAQLSTLGAARCAPNSARDDVHGRADRRALALPKARVLALPKACSHVLALPLDCLSTPLGARKALVRARTCAHSHASCTAKRGGGSRAGKGWGKEGGVTRGKLCVRA
eukprot:6062119-Pleurochrysis_carterae.AAC.1